MEQIKKLVQIDLLAIKPYLTAKNLLILLALSVFYAFVSKSPVILLSTSQVGAFFFCSYPFLVGDEAGIDALYRIFGIRSENVVYGRYLTGMLLTGSSLVLGALIALALSMLLRLKGALLGLLISAPIIFLITTALISAQYPFYFKYGYVKGKTIASIPFFIIAVLLGVGSFFSEALRRSLPWILAHIPAVVAAGLLVWLLIGISSIMISKKWYQQRDF